MTSAWSGAGDRRAASRKTCPGGDANGCGKVPLFSVPALVLGGLAVVISPLIALMQDQVNALRLNGVAADSINSGKSRADNGGRLAAGGKR